MLTTRFLIVFGVFFVFCAIINVACIGFDFNSGPLTGFRRRIKLILGDLGCRIMVFVAGMRLDIVRKKVDYTEYLGPNY